MNMIDVVVWLCLIAVGYAIKGAVDDARYVKFPRAKHEWQCPHCPMIFGTNTLAILAEAKADHLVKMHGGDQ